MGASHLPSVASISCTGVLEANLRLAIMRVAVAICALVAFTNAQLGPSTFGPSGIVKPDGKNVQFTLEEANNVVLVGPSGAVMADGKNIQFRKKRSAVDGEGNLWGPSGAVLADGTQIQYKKAGATIALEGPSGIIFTDGTLVQKRSKRSVVNAVRSGHVVGDSGIVFNDGTLVQFKAGGVNEAIEAFKAAGFTVALDGPSGILLSDGTQIQKRAKRSILNTAGHLIGDSGAVLSNGKLIQFKAAFNPAGAPQLIDGMKAAGMAVASEGPSGIVFTDGTLIQKRAKRSINAPGHLVGASGAVLSDGKQVQFKAGGVSGIIKGFKDAGVAVAADGPSGIVFTNGIQIQKRAKRATVTNTGHSIGDSGIVFSNGKQIQFKIGGVSDVELLNQFKQAGFTIALEGPSGALLSDGTQIQKRAKRSILNGSGHLVGPSGVVLSNGKQVQFKSGDISAVIEGLKAAGVTVASEGPSGIVFTDGINIQKRAKRATITSTGHLIGDSGAVLSNGKQIQFKEGGVTVLLEGPSGLILSDGTQIQL